MPNTEKEETISVVKLVDYTISICRVCSLSTECQNIFTMNYCDLTFADLFYYATRIELAPEDNPYHVCLMCIGKLLNAYEFIIQCEKSWYAQKQVRMSVQLAENKQYKAIAPKPLTVLVDIPKEMTGSTNDSRFAEEEVIVITNQDEIINVIEQEPKSSVNVSKVRTLPIKKQKLLNVTDKEDDGNAGKSNEKETKKGEVEGDGDIFKEILQELAEAEVVSNYGDNSDNEETETEEESEIMEGDVKPPYKCLKCEKQFRKIHALNRHMLEHLSGKHICHTCNKEYSNPKLLAKHLQCHSSSSRMMCELCGKIFFKQSLKSHMERHHSEEATEFADTKSCSICSIPVASRQELAAHMHAVHTEKDHLCSVCGKTFSGLARLKKHMLIHDERRRVSCTICNKTFSSRESLKQHIYTHTGIKPYQCDICGKRCTQSQQLKAHIRIHTGDKPYTCKFCGTSFTTSATLKIHVRGRHFNDKPFVCEICGKCFIQRGPLERHLRLHACGRKTGNNQNCQNSWGCTLCKLVFDTRRELLAHNCPNIHLAPFECSECGKRFRIKPLLTVHMRIHTGEQPFKCQYCPKAFRSKAGLKEHIYMHTGEKRFVCDICGKGCVQKQQLVSHMRIHTGVRPYKCYICGSTFTLKGNLTVHMRTHTGETPYKCECGASYCASNALKRHQTKCKLFIYEETVNECEVYAEDVEYEEAVSN